MLIEHDIRRIEIIVYTTDSTMLPLASIEI